MMKPAASLYTSARVAAGYAFGRPAVHAPILERVREHLRLATPVSRALDAGCGAGRSTAALRALAADVVGLDPAAAMLEHRRRVAPDAHFVVGGMEQLPFADAAFDLVTAAGSINYANLDLALPELARVLAPGATLVIYDFSAGRRLADGKDLEEWYREFDRRYPDAPGYGLDVRRLPWDAAGLAVDGYEEFEDRIPMTLDSYLRYTMSETRIGLALSAGARESEIGAWCAETLAPLFGDLTRDVLFEGYVLYLRNAGVFAP